MRNSSLSRRVELDVPRDRVLVDLGDGHLLVIALEHVEELNDVDVVHSSSVQVHDADVELPADLDGPVGVVINVFADEGLHGSLCHGDRALVREGIGIERLISRIQRSGTMIGTYAGAASKRRRSAHKPICKHQRIRSQCKECGGASICEHQRIRSRCMEGRGTGICVQQRQRSKCKEGRETGTWQNQRIRSGARIAESLLADASLGRID